MKSTQKKKKRQSKTQTTFLSNYFKQSDTNLDDRLEFELAVKFALFIPNSICSSLLNKVKRIFYFVLHFAFEKRFLHLFFSLCKLNTSQYEQPFILNK